jgi:hypothetical protein
MQGSASYSRAKPRGKPSAKKAQRGYESDDGYESDSHRYMSERDATRYDQVDNTHQFEAQVIFMLFPGKSDAYVRVVTVLAAALFVRVSSNKLATFVAKVRFCNKIVTGLSDFVIGWEPDMAEEDQGVINDAVDKVYEPTLEDDQGEKEIPDATQVMRDAQRVAEMARKHFLELKEAFIKKYGESKEEAEAAFFIKTHNFEYNSKLSFEAETDERDVKRVNFATPELITNRKDFEEYVDRNCDAGLTNFFYRSKRGQKRSRY